jgi:hypothetical protein
MRSDQVVNIGQGSTIDALGNVDVKAGVAEGGRWDTIVTAGSSAQGYVRGLIAIPDSKAESFATSNATVSILSGSTETTKTRIKSGINAAIAAAPGFANPTADGTARGFQLGFIPVTERDSNATPVRSSVVTFQGELTAGAYSTIDLEIADCQNSGVYCSTIQDKGSTAPYTAVFHPSFDWNAWRQANLGGLAAGAEVDGISGTPVGAVVLDATGVSGGVATIHADSLTGGGTVTANGRPLIRIRNLSRDYIILRGAVIPDLPGGRVLFTGAAKSGLTVTENFAGLGGILEVKSLFNCAGRAPCVGDSNLGPAIIVAGEIENLGGQVLLETTSGSIADVGGGITAGVVNLLAPEGFIRIQRPNPNNPHLSSNPYTEWRNVMIWPGGAPHNGEPNGDRAAEWAATARYHAAVPENVRWAFGINSFLYGFAGANPSTGNNRSYVYFGACLIINGAGGCDEGTARHWSPSNGAVHHTNSNIVPRWYPSVQAQPMSKTAVASQADTTLSRSGGLSARNIAITGNTIDINTQVNVGGSSEWSVSLSAGLGDQLRTYRLYYRWGIVSRELDLTTLVSAVRPGDSQLRVKYDAERDEIVVENVVASSGGAKVLIDGGLMSTNTLGRITVNAGLGRVEVDNQSGITVVVNNVYTGAGSASASADESQIELVDHFRNKHSLWVYKGGQGVTLYEATRGSAAAGNLRATTGTLLAGNSTTYDPLAGQRWQWTESAHISRTYSYDPTQASHWTFSGNRNDPWTRSSQRLTGQAADLPFFRQNITVAEHYGLYQWGVTMGGCNGDGWCNYGYRRDDTRSDGRAPWIHYYPTQAWITMTMSVKADNPIAISFSGLGTSEVTINSNAAVILDGKITNPGGATTIRTTNGSITATDKGSIVSRDVTLSSTTGGLGTRDRPIAITLADGTRDRINARTDGTGGIFLKIDSGAILGDIVSGGPRNGSDTAWGDVVIEAVGSLRSVAPVKGRNITLRSTTGAIGTAGSPIEIQARPTALLGGATSGGVVNVEGSGAVHLVQRGADLLAGTIRSVGSDVTVTVIDGGMLDARGQTASGVLSSAQVAASWARLGLTGGDADAQALATVATFKRTVEVTYQDLWRLRLNGTYTADDQYALSTASIARYLPGASAALGRLATDDEVKAYAAYLYRRAVAFFDNADVAADATFRQPLIKAPLPSSLGPVLGAGWRSLAAFTTYVPGFSHTVTPEQETELKKNAKWTEAELTTALDATGAAPVGVGSPNIVGNNVTLTVSRGIGRSGAVVTIAIADLRNGTLTNEQKAALALATAPGDAMLVGTTPGNATERRWVVSGQPDDAIITRVELGRTAPLFVDVTGVLNATAGHHAFLQGTSESLRIGKVTAGGDVRLTSRVDLVAAGPGTQVETPGNVYLSAGSGSIAGSAAPTSTTAFTLHMGGRLISAESGARLILAQTNGTLRFDRMLAAGAARITVAGGGLEQVQQANTGIRATELTVTVRDAIGSPAKPVQIELDPGGALTAIAPAGIDIISKGDTALVLVESANGNVTLDIRGDALVSRILARNGTVSLFSDGSVLDARAGDSGDRDGGEEIIALMLALRSMTGVGTEADPLETSVQRLEVRSFADMWIKNFGDAVVGGVSDGLDGVHATGRLRLVLASTLTVDEEIKSDGADVWLAASEGIIVNRDVSSGGGTITFRAGTFISMTDGTVVDAGTGLIDLLADGNVTLSLLRTTGLAKLVTTGGSFLDADTTGANDVEAGTAQLTASGSIGTAANPLEIVAGIATLTAGSEVVVVQTAGGLVLTGLTSAVGDLVITVRDSAAAGETLTIGGTVRSLTGSVTLRAGDGLHATDATIQAATAIVLVADHLSQDAATDALTLTRVALDAGSGITIAATGAVALEDVTATATAGGIGVTAGGLMAVTRGTYQAAGDILLTSTGGAISITGATATAGGALRAIAATGVTLASATLTAASDLVLTGPSALTANGTTLRSTAGAITLSSATGSIVFGTTTATAATAIAATGGALALTDSELAAVTSLGATLTGTLVALRSTLTAATGAVTLAAGRQARSSGRRPARPAPR